MKVSFASAVCLAAANLSSVAFGADQQGRTSKETVYQTACYTGVVAAQEVLPKAPQQDELTSRGYASCDGSLLRLRKSGDLERETDVPGFACGYAVGAMFAKYGFGEEAEKLRSLRARKAVDLCLERLKKQGIGK